MKKFNKIQVAIFASSILTSCADKFGDLGSPPSDDVVTEAEYLLKSIEKDGGVPYNASNPALTFSADENVFIPSVLGLDYRIDRSVVPQGPTARFPMFQGWETLPDGSYRKGYYVITEASDRSMATILGVIYSPRMANAIGSGGEQNGKWTEHGRLVFDGYVDFSPKRSLVAGGTSDDGLLVGFPPAEVNPGAIASDSWSSYVVLPSGIVINAQMVANETGIHDRIPNPAGNRQENEDDLNNPNLAIDQASVVMQLLDGWQDGRPYYFHIVTDTSDPAPAAIELGVFAPRLANLPTFGAFPGGSMLPFSPTANGRTSDNGDGLGVQGLNTASISDRQVQDPTNTFPIDPSDERYSPMWDAHITEFTVPENERPILTSFDQINELMASGVLRPFRGNPLTETGSNPLTNTLSDLLTPTGAIINCPVVSQPLASAIGRQIGSPRNLSLIHI